MYSGGFTVLLKGERGVFTLRGLKIALIGLYVFK